MIPFLALLLKDPKYNFLENFTAKFDVANHQSKPRRTWGKIPRERHFKTGLKINFIKQVIEKVLNFFVV